MANIFTRLIGGHHEEWAFEQRGRRCRITVAHISGQHGHRTSQQLPEVDVRTAERLRRRIQGGS